jgi:hypothetical protein
MNRRLATLALLMILPACDSGDAAADKAPAEEAKKADDGAKPEADKKDEAPAKGPAEEAVPAAAGKVFFVAPADGAKLGTEFEVEFGVEGKKVIPAGATERNPEEGHHHLLVDVDAMPDGEVIPMDDQHIHYGDGSTKASVTLPPGKHTLVMQFADGAHRSYGPDWSAKITVEVE